MLTRPLPLLALAAALATGCGLDADARGDEAGTPPRNQPGDDPDVTGPGDDPAPDGDADTDADADADADADTDTGGGDTDTAPSSQPVRFIAVGDAGRGNAEQYQVAGAIESTCAAKGCDFAIYLGDNFYDDGVSSISDAQFEEKFETPYQNLSFKFYAALGNHDYGGGGGGFETDRAAAQVEYTNHSDKWVMTDEFYTHVQGDVGFLVLDTTALDWGQTGDQAAWVPGALTSLNTRWKIAYGHHPYVSNGSHGNANDNYGPFFEQYLCGQVDVYFAGHDHDLQWLEPTCGTEFVISGAGSSTRDVGGSNPTKYERSGLGFMWVEIDGDTLTGVFYDENGAELYRDTVVKQ